MLFVVERNLRLYPLFHVARAGFFWLPTFFLFFASKVTPADALRLGAIYYVLFVVLEVPSGYVSDRFGRKVALLISNAAGLAGGLTLFVAHDFVTIAAGQALLATWFAFHSGTDVALLADSLHALGRDAELGRRESRAEAWGRAFIGASALVGGWAATRSLALPYLLFAGSAALTFVVVLLFVEPARERAAPPLQQARAVVGRLRDSTLAWVSAFVVGMTVVNHIPYELFQPYLELLTSDRFDDALQTPLLAGGVMAVNMWIAAVGARVSIPLAERVGQRAVLLLAAGGQTIVILSMGALLHPVVAALLALRSLPPGLAGPIVTAVAQPRLSGGERATFFSLLSLCGRTLHAGVMALMSLGLAVDAVRWDALQRVLLAAGGAAALFTLGLIVTSRALKASKTS
jgi:MFS family permease